MTGRVAGSVPAVYAVYGVRVCQVKLEAEDLQIPVQQYGSTRMTRPVLKIVKKSHEQRVCFRSRPPSDGGVQTDVYLERLAGDAGKTMRVPVASGTDCPHTTTCSCTLTLLLPAVGSPDKTLRPSVSAFGSIRFLAFSFTQ